MLERRKRRDADWRDGAPIVKGVRTGLRSRHAG